MTAAFGKPQRSDLVGLSLPGCMLPKITFHRGNVVTPVLTGALHGVHTDAVFIYYASIGHVCTHLQTPAFENVLHSWTLERQRNGLTPRPLKFFIRQLLG